LITLILTPRLGLVREDGRRARPCRPRVGCCWSRSGCVPADVSSDLAARCLGALRDARGCSRGRRGAERSLPMNRRRRPTCSSIPGSTISARWRDPRIVNGAMSTAMHIGSQPPVLEDQCRHVFFVLRACTTSPGRAAGRYRVVWRREPLTCAVGLLKSVMSHVSKYGWPLVPVVRVAPWDAMLPGVKDEACRRRCRPARGVGLVGRRGPMPKV